MHRESHPIRPPPHRQSYSGRPDARRMVVLIACKLCGRNFKLHGGGHVSYCNRCMERAGGKLHRVLSLKCAVCGKGFSASTSLARYCSDGCRTEGRCHSYRECYRRRMADPETRALVRARGRVAAAALAARKRGGRGRGRPQAGRGAASPPRSAEGIAVACDLCGRNFVPRGRASPLYCGRCTARSERELARVLRVKCKECGRTFSTKDRIVRYCSDECSAAGVRRGRLESVRRRMPDPQRRAVAAARTRAWNAAQKDKAGRRRGRPRAQRPAGSPPDKPARGRR